MLGCEVGGALGLSLGDSDSWAVGKDVGRAVEHDDGWMEGLVDGSDDGGGKREFDGFDEGWVMGEILGSDIGRKDGKLEGGEDG